MQRKKLLFIFGTRPEAIKMAPLILKLKTNPLFETKVCVTGQHRELLDSVLKTFSLIPDYDLAVMTKNQDLSSLTSKLLEGLTDVISKETPDLVLVQGDTTSAMAGAMAAFYNKVDVAHIEAGLRTESKKDPFPEEVNRRIISQIADYHFTPTENNKQNLANNGVTESVFVTGNTGLDALRYVNEKIEKHLLPASGYLLSFIDSKIILVTIHRRENQGSSIVEIIKGLNLVAGKYTDYKVILIRHPNPTLNSQKKALSDQSLITVIDPVSYSDMIHLIKKASLIITDSGGLQEESAFLGTPAIIVRSNTERNEAVELGITKIVSAQSDNILNEVVNILDNNGVYTQMAQPSTVFGDGHSIEMIENILEKI